MKRLKKSNRVFINSIEAFCACLCAPCGCGQGHFTCDSYCGTSYDLQINKGAGYGQEERAITENSHYTLIANRAERGWGR